MAAEVTLNVKLDDARAKAGLKAIADSIKPLSTPVKIDIDTKDALKSLRDLNTVASNLEKQLNKGREGLGNGHDEWLRKQANDAKAFSNALRQQMQAEQEAAQSRKGLVSEMNAWDQAIHANEASGKAFAAALKQQMQAEQEAAREAKKAGQAAKKSGDDASQGASGWTMLGGAISTALGHLASRAVTWALNKVKQGIREALDEMKNVDTELTNISKVSGKTGAELEAIGDAAYETASRYGVAAHEYLASVYDMQKAGMGDQAEAMGELAIKTMLVGDTTQEVASKFLLASNAAWKLNGDMGALTQIVDEADYINNNYATTLDKLAAGMPIVASVAAQAGMSAEETMAALGTITTVTQESGTKAATALRALILNISGAVGEYVTEEGETFEVTEESVKSLEGLLWKYAKAEMQAAKDAGELIDPMTAIQALFKGMSEGDVNDVELFNLLSSMGGKLRTNQLTALVQNYELFDEMLVKIGDSAGTADSEIELMMNSWERKTQVLKNTWTEFIADIVDTDTIKGAVDFLTDVVDGMDDAINRLKNPFYDSENTQKEYDGLKAEYDTLIAKGDSLNSAEKIRLDYLEKQLAVLKLQAEAEEKQAAEKLQREMAGNHRDEHTLTLYGNASNDIQFEGDITAYQQSLKGLNAQYSEYYNNLTKVRDAGVELTDAQREFMSMYEDNSVAAMADIVDVRPTLDGYWALIDAQGNVVAYEQDITKLVEARAEAAELAAEGESYTANQLEESMGAVRQAYEDMETAREAGDSEAYAEAAQRYNEELAKVRERADELKAAESEATSEAQNTADAAGGIGPQVDTAIPAVNRLTSAFQAAAQAASGISVGAVGGSVGGGGHATGTKNAPGGPTLVNELGPELISENGRAYIANGGRPGVVNLSRGAIVLTAKETEKALKGNKAAKSIHAAVRGAGNTSGTNPSSVIVNGTNIALTGGSTNVVITVPQPITSGTSAEPGSGGSGGGSRRRSSGGGGGGGGGSTRKKKKKKSIKTYAEELEDLLSNLDKQAKLADNEGDYAREVEIWEQAQEAINTMVERYRKAGYAEDSDEILDLLNKNYDYANKQVKLYEDVWDDLIDALETDAEQQELANKLAEKQLALQEAQEALENAQSQRSVRVYNAETGQWERVADQKKITSAQKTLDKAQEAYNDEVRSQAIKELEAMKDTVTDLTDVVLGPALSAVALMAESSEEFQNFARALNAVYGVGTFLASTEGSDKVLETKDSHDTVYSFGDVVLTEEQASTTTLAELAQMLKVLDTTT